MPRTSWSKSRVMGRAVASPFAARTLVIASVALLGVAAVEAAGPRAAAPSGRETKPAAAAAPAREAGPEQVRTIDDAIKLVRQRQAAMERVHDYTATFTKTELVGKKVIQQTMDMKCRHEPFSVYLRNRSGKEEGREVLYVAGAHEDHLLVHERGFLASIAGTQSLKLDDSLVMDENRYPITDIGIAKILDKSLKIWESEQKADASNIEVRYITDAKAGAVPCDELEVVRKKERPGFDYSLTRVFFAKDSTLPIRAEQYGWPAGAKAPLLEEYDYTNLRTNVGLTDADFDAKNPMYGFK